MMECFLGLGYGREGEGIRLMNKMGNAIIPAGEKKKKKKEKI